jgi:hypothetical protein
VIAATLSVLDFRGDLGLALGALGQLVSRVRGMGVLAGIGLVVTGVALLAAADRLRRPVAFLGGAAVGALAVMAARSVVPGALGSAAWSWVAAAVCGAVSSAAPPVFPALAGALVGALMGLHLPVAGKPVLGALLAGAVGAALLAVSARSVAAILASLTGGLALGVGLVTLAGGREIAAELASRPLVLLGFAVVTGVAGAAFQLSAERAGRERLPEPPRLPRE